MAGRCSGSLPEEVPLDFAGRPILHRQCFGEAEIYGHVICLVTFAWRARFGVGSSFAEFDFKTLHRYLEADQSQSKAYCVAHSIEVNSVLGGATVDKCWPELRDVSRTERFNMTNNRPTVR
jgi:hypothetical protein